MSPSPLPILARRSLPQTMNQITAPINNKTIARRIPVMILRFLLMGFLDFFGFLEFSSFLVVALFMDWSLLALSSPVCSSKSKVWIGARNSAAEVLGSMESWGSIESWGFMELGVVGLVA